MTVNAARTLTPARDKPPRVPPTPVVRGAMGAVARLGALQRRLQPGYAALADQIAGAFLTSRIVYVVAELGIADELAAGSRTTAELARRVGANEDALRRVLRAAASLGVLDMLPGDAFQTNRLGRALEEDSPQSMRAWARYVGAPWHQELWSGLTDAVRTGSDLYRLRHQKPFFEHFAAEPGQQAVFDAGMTGLSALSDEPIAAAYPFGRAARVVDVAGGLGGQLAAILRRHRRVRGTLFDQASVIERARRIWTGERATLLPRAELSTGDFFRSVPAGADTYLLKSIIHDWDDDRAVEILSRCREAMPRLGRVLLAELVLPDSAAPHFGKLLDIAMLALTGGRERTAAEYATLLERAGLRLARVVPTASPYSLVVGVLR
jgi:hypothetical protein